MDKQNTNPLDQEYLGGANNKDKQIIKSAVDSIFTGDSYGLFVFKKTERLVTAIYMLTGLLSDKEPLKDKLRSTANDMISGAFSLSDRIWGEEIYLKNLLSSIYQAITFFEIAKASKMVSEMNYGILNNELRKLADFLVNSSSNYSSAKIAFEHNLFDGNYNFTPDQGVAFPTQSIFGGFPVSSGNYYKGQKDIKDNQNGNVLDDLSSTKPLAVNKIVRDKNERQEIIISMLKNGERLTIKDFAKNIKDCSEKTIQRELISLVSKGVLKKEGERRWSRYSLV